VDIKLLNSALAPPFGSKWTRKHTVIFGGIRALSHRFQLLQYPHFLWFYRRVQSAQTDHQNIR